MIDDAVWDISYSLQTLAAAARLPLIEKRIEHYQKVSALSEPVRKELERLHVLRSTDMKTLRLEP